MARTGESWVPSLSPQSPSHPPVAPAALVPGGQDALIDRSALGGPFSECTWRVTVSASWR